MPQREEEQLSTVARGIRLDLIIAVCALLISTLAAAASIWQARVVAVQTAVLQQQLGAEVWPYVSVSENISGDTAQISIANDGLGPAILRSASAFVDGKSKSNFLAILNAILGPNIVARKPRGEKLNIQISGGTPGSVLRPGVTQLAFGITSKRYARPFIQGFRRIRIRLCYCAIIPGKCWLSDTSSNADPQPIQACPEIPNDLLHASAVEQLLNRKF